MKTKKGVGTDQLFIGTKYTSCAVSKEDLERAEQKRIGRIFTAAVFIAYVVIIAVIIAAIAE